jgi:hypothetical protein
MCPGALLEQILDLVVAVEHTTIQTTMVVTVDQV